VILPESLGLAAGLFRFYIAMNVTNAEIKAVCRNQAAVRNILRELQARFVGEDQQTDTYFNVPTGRLKLREGLIENALIFYRRPDTEAPKISDVKLFSSSELSGIKPLLTAALGVKVTVVKQREIYFVDNVKIHLDRVAELGEFVEIEAIDNDGSRTAAELLRQCQAMLERLGIQPADRLTHSYSDMLLIKQAK